MSTNKSYQLPKEFAEKWLSALRSGEYKQQTDKGQLYDPNTDCYCVLGVLAKANGIEISANGFDLVEDGKSVDYDPIHNLIGEEATTAIYRLNDDQKKSFTELAEWIESNVEFT